jgi:hypothetical protein
MVPVLPCCTSTACGAKWALWGLFARRCGGMSVLQMLPCHTGSQPVVRRRWTQAVSLYFGDGLLTREACRLIPKPCF